MGDKEQELVSQLLEKTRSKRLVWEATAQGEAFFASFGGGYSVSISIDTNALTAEQYFVVKVWDPTGSPVVSIGSWDADVSKHAVSQLYDLARRAALKVDESLDKVLDDLRKL